ncbi:MAG: S16 family serine protease, partial [Candidatus Bathyarchaeia archaeon]
DSILVTAVGGVHEKIRAAEAWGFKKVVIPRKNYEHSIDPRDYKIEVTPAATLDDYLKECLVEEATIKVPIQTHRKPKI